MTATDPVVLVLTPVKNASAYLDSYFRALDSLTYPKKLLSLGFLEGDSTDTTYAAIAGRLDALRRQYRKAELWQKHFGLHIRGSKRAPAIQPQRRSVLAKARNHLLMHALDDEQWVLWLDVDVVEYPSDVIETMLATQKDVVQPNCVLRYGARSFDLNAWRDRGRLHLHDLREEGDLVPLDAVGGTMLLVRADVHRDGVIFPPFPYGLANPKVRTDNHWRGELETEGFGIMASDAGVQCWGMPNVEIRHDAGPGRPPRSMPVRIAAARREMPRVQSPHIDSPHIDSPHVHSPSSPASPYSPHIRLELSESDVRAGYRRALEERIHTLSDTAPRTFSGRGIVICAGGNTYFTCAWVCISMLRRLGCTLPIELWYRGRREMTGAAIELVEQKGVTCIDAYPVARQQGYRRLDSWEIKPFAIANSSFAEVLLLDADNVPVRNPEFLFDCDLYQQHGALFWPDFCGGNAAEEWLDRRAWDVCGVPFRNEPEFESGQIVVDKRRCWAPLTLTLHLNEHSDYYYEFFYGDKDTFHLAWRRLGRSYGLMPHRPIRYTGTMQQHDMQRQPLFLHRSIDKWSLSRRNHVVPQFLYESLCREALSELRGRWTPPMRQFPSELTAVEGEMYDLLIGASEFTLTTPRRHRRVKLFSNFTLHGSNNENGLWSIEEDKDGEPVLRLEGLNPYYTMRPIGDNVWRGRSRERKSHIAELHPLR